MGGAADALRRLGARGDYLSDPALAPRLRAGPGESTPDFLARAMREDHGFTVPGRSLLAPDVVEGPE
jgi:hypothetical protein